MASLTRKRVLDVYNEFPFERHPLWKAILDGELSHDEVMRAETQHYIRSKVGREFRRRAAEESRLFSERAHELLMETYREECLDDESGPSHLELIERLLLMGGVTDEQLKSAIPTSGNAAAIALYKDITDRSPLHHMIGAGAVEYYYSVLSPRIYEAYTEKYRFTPEQAETYRIHGPMDREHAERALQILDEAYVQDNAESIALAVRDAFAATSLHYDGMLQAALGRTEYWNAR